MTCKVLLHHYGRFTSPPRRSFVGGLVATVDPVELERFSTNQVKRILTYSLGYDENSPTFLYLRKPNCSFDSGLVKLADALQDRNMLLTYAQSHQNRLHIYVSRVEISPLVVANQHKDEENKQEKQGKPSYMISYLTRKISRRFTTLYYTLPPNNTLSGLKQIKNDYDTNVMYDIAKVAGKIQLFVSHHQIDLSTVLIPNDGSLEEAFADDARTTIVSNLQRELEAEATLANTMLGNLTRYFEQMRIREIQITMLQNMPTMSLNSYGLHALLMTHEADIRTTNNLIRARQELLRSIAEKQNFINNYRAI
ncbi:hypothetical protein Tco_0583113 [Tanacetum coccineum]